MSRLPTASLTHVPAGRKHVKALGAEQLTTCGAARISDRRVPLATVRWSGTESVAKWPPFAKTT